MYPSSSITPVTKSLYPRLNEAHHSLSLVLTHDPQSVDFLDLTIHKGANFTKHNHLDTKLYRKPCDNLAPLPYHSSHPPSIFKGIFMGEVTRLIRNTSCPDRFRRELRNLVTGFAGRGYPRKYLLRWLSTTFYDNRDKLLMGKCKTIEWSTDLASLSVIHCAGMPRPSITEAMNLKDYPFVPRITLKPPTNLQRILTRNNPPPP